MVNSSTHFLKFVQLNLHKSKSATQQLILNMEQNNIDCALIQEPHCYRGSLVGYPSCYRIYYDVNSENIKAAIIIRSKVLSIFVDYETTDYNMVTLDIRFQPTTFTLFPIILNLPEILIMIFIKLIQFF